MNLEFNTSMFEIPSFFGALMQALPEQLPKVADDFSKGPATQTANRFFELIGHQVATI